MPYAAAMNEPGEAELDDLIARATVDCYNEDEELTGFATMIGDNLAVPFETTVLGVTVTVRKINYSDSGIVAICARGKHRQAIPSLTCPCRTRLRGVPSGSPPTAAGQDRGSRHARPGSTANTADLPG
jgi:hypothetical protein